MFEEALNKIIKEETEKLNSQQLADLNGQRVINNFSLYINQNIEALLKTQNGQELLDKSIVLLRNTTKALQEITTELNSQRREQRARVVALQDSLNVIIDVSKRKEAESNKVKAVAEKIKNGENFDRRRPGDRPETLKVRRKAEALVAEGLEGAVDEQGVPIENDDSIETIDTAKLENEDIEARIGDKSDEPKEVIKAEEPKQKEES